MAVHSETFPSRSHTYALDRVATALSGGAAVMVVTGPSGVGKTTLCAAVAGATDDRAFGAAIRDARMQADDVLAQLLRDFGLIADAGLLTPAHNRDELVAAVTKFLVSLKPLGAHAVVVVDDAERIASSVLGVLNDVARAADPDGRLLRLVLVGQPSLESRLQEPMLEDLASRVSERIALTALEREELLPYISHRAFTLDGGEAGAREWSTADLDEVFAESEGIPSRVNFFAARVRQQAAILPALAVPASPAEDDASDVAPPVPSGVRRWPALIGLVLVVGALAVGWWRYGRQGSAGVGGAVTAPVQAPAAATPGRPPEVPASPGPDVAPAPPPAAAAAPSEPAPQATSPGAGSAARATAGSDAAGPAGQFRIAVAAFRTSARAESVAAQLRERQLAVTARPDRTGTWFQVVAGPYPTLEAAREAQRTLEKAGYADSQISLPPAPAAEPDAAPR